MKHDELHINELIEFKPGWVGLKGRRLVIHDIHAFLQLRKDLRATLGVTQTRRMLHRFGYAWGQADAAAMQRIFKWDDLREWMLAGPQMQSLQGVVKSSVERFEVNPAQKTFSMKLVWRHSHEAEDYLEAFGKNDIPVCCMLVSYISGYMSYCLNADVYFIERKCVGMGEKVCVAEGRDLAAWGPEIEPMLTNYEVDAIEEKIQSLTKELRQKDRELSRQRRQFALVAPAEMDNMIGIRSAIFRRTFEMAQRVARFDSTVLVTGESGTGKEVLARYVHAQSPRAKAVFLAINCGALPETLLESELFGHTAGAFTGAMRERTGLFEQARGGTIFLDEIGDITPALQIKLLRVLQNREIMRVGESRPRQVDVRVIAATNKNLLDEIQAERFREDLYYRLNVIEIHVPPLRERQEDILPLARHFVKRCAKVMKIPQLRLDPAALDAILRHQWPGNVRELENAIEHAAILCHEGVIMPEHLPVSIQVRRPAAAGMPAVHGEQLPLHAVEHSHIQAVLAACDGNRTRAAKTLGISPATLWRKLKAMD